MEKNNWRFDHAGIVVRDINKAVEYFEALGIGPFETSKGTSIIERMVHGKPASDVKNVTRIAKLGPVSFELLQTISGASIQKEFLDSKGEGINHLDFYVDDIEEETAKLVAKGFKIVQSGKFVGGGGMAYFDTDKLGGVQIGLVQRPPGA